LDAICGKRHDRFEAIRMGKDLDANIVFVECVLAENILEVRLLKRETGHPVSDACFRHHEDFKKRFESLDELDEMPIRIDTEKPLEACMKHILGYRSNRKALNLQQGNDAFNVGFD